MVNTAPQLDVKCTMILIRLDSLNVSQFRLTRLIYHTTDQAGLRPLSALFLLVVSI